MATNFFFHFKISVVWPDRYILQGVIAFSISTRKIGSGVIPSKLFLTPPSQPKVLKCLLSLIPIFVEFNSEFNPYFWQICECRDEPEVGIKFYKLVS